MNDFKKVSKLTHSHNPMRIPMLSGDSIVARSIAHFRLQFSTYLQVIILMLGGLFIIGVIDELVSAGLSKVLAPHITTFAQVLSSNLLYKTIAGAVLLLWFTYTQGLLIHTSLNRQKSDLRTLFNHFKKDYLKFLALSIILLIIATAALIPFYAFGIITVMDIPYSQLIGILLLILFVIVLLACLWGLMFAPFIMLDLHSTIKSTLSINAALVKNKFKVIIKNMILPFALIVTINMIIGSAAPAIGALLSLAYLIFILPWLYSYIATLYIDLKQS